MLWGSTWERASEAEGLLCLILRLVSHLQLKTLFYLLNQVRIPLSVMQFSNSYKRALFSFDEQAVPLLHNSKIVWNDIKGMPINMKKLFSIILFLYKFSSTIRLAEVQSELIPQDFKNIFHQLFLLPNLLAVVTTASRFLVPCWVIILKLSLRGKDLIVSVEI